MKILLNAGAKVDGFHPGDKGQNTTLLRCAFEGSDEAILLLLNSGANVNAQSRETGNTALHLFASGHQESRVRLLVSHGAKVNFKNREGLLPIHLAVKNAVWESEREKVKHWIATVNVLLELGSDVNAPAPEGATLLLMSAAQDVLRSSGIPLKILRSGARNLEAAYEGYELGRCSAACIALYNQDRSLLEELLNRGAKLNARDKVMQAVFQKLYLNKEYYHKTLPALFIRNILPANQRFQQTQKWRHWDISALYWAAYFGDLEMVLALLKNGASVENGYISKTQADSREISERSTALVVAVEHGFTEIVRALLAVDQERKLDQKYSQAFSDAAVNGNSGPLKVFLKAGFNPNLHDGKRDSCRLINVLGTSLAENLDLLLSHGADPNLTCQNANGKLEYPLVESIWTKREGLLAKLLAAGANPRLCPQVLVKAASFGIEFVRPLVEKGADVDFAAGGYRTALYEAAREGDEDVVRYLLKSKAKIDPADKSLPSPFHVALMERHERVATLLMDAGAFHNPDPKGQPSALYLALSNHYESLAVRIFDKGVKVTDLTYWPYMKRAAETGSVVMINNLLSIGALATEKGAIHGAAYFGHEHAIERLVQAGEDVNREDDYFSDQLWSPNVVPLYLAAYRGHVAAVETLLRLGAIPNTNPSAVYAAAEGNYGKIIKALAAKKASLESGKWPIGKNPLQAASGKGALDAVTALIESGAQINYVDTDHCTALHYALSQCQSEVASFLMAKSANVNEVCNNSSPGFSGSRDKNIHALHFAASCKKVDSLRQLLNLGAKPNILREDGFSPLAGFVRNVGNDSSMDEVISIVRLFAAKGADVNLAGDKAKTPLAVARSVQHPETQRLVNTLLELGASPRPAQKRKSGRLAHAL